MEDIEAFVAEERAALNRGFESSGVDERGAYFAVVSRDAHRVGLGLLVVGESDTAAAWFGDLADGWVRTARTKWEGRIDDDPHVGRLPWRQLYDALRAAVLSADRDFAHSVAADVEEFAFTPSLDDLPGWEESPRPSVVRAFVRLLRDGNDITGHLEAVRARLGRDGFDPEYLGAQADAIEAISCGDTAGIVAAVERATTFHESSFVDNDELHPIESAVSADACTFVVLARMRGLDVRVDSQFVPEAVYDLV